MRATTVSRGRRVSRVQSSAPRILLFSWIVLIVLILSACGTPGGLSSLAAPSIRILFIGNSFTYFNGGVDQALRGLAPSVAVERLASAGYTLADHWDGPHALKSIHAQKWDYVVMQDQSQAPVLARAAFIEYAGKFANEIRAAGAQPVLFMTWQRPDSVQYGVTTQNLASSYFQAGNRFGIKVAPVGLAFARALQEKPELALNVQDGHPTVQGTYLAACVIYATIFAKSPIGIHYALSGIPQDEQDFLQRIAAESTGH